MQKPNIPANESDRQAALDRYKILDTLPEQVYDELTQLAADICGTPIALISLIHNDRQWFKSRVGLEATETPRDISFCGHAVAAKAILNVPDASQDPRFADNPLVADDPNIRFYAGIPLITEDSFALGTLCVIDRIPRNLTDLQIRQLEALSRLVISQFELRLKEDTVNERTNELQQAIADLQQENQQRLKTEASLRESQKLFASLAAAAPVGIFRTDTEGKCIYVNERWLQVSGLTLLESLDFGWINGIHPSDRELVFAEWNTAIEEDRPFSLEYRFQNKSGQITWTFGQAVAERDQFNQIIGYVGTITDISDRKQAESARFQSEKLRLELTLLEQILEVILAGYWDWDIPNNQEYLSPGFKQMFGYADHEMANSPESWQRIIFEADLPNVLDCFNRHVQSRGEVPFYNEVRYHHQDGSTVWVLCSGRVIEWDESGNPMRMIGCHIDITQSKQLEIQLQASEATIRATLEAIPDLLLRLRRDGTCVEYIRPGIRTDNFLPVENHVSEVLPPELLQNQLQIIEQAMLTGELQVYEHQFLKRDRMVYEEIRIVAINDQEVLAIVRDISDRKKAEQQLNQQLSAIEAAVDGIAILKDDCYVYLNSSHVNLFGYDRPDDLLGKSWRTLYSPEEIQRIEREVFPVIGANRHWEGEAIAIRKDGTTFTEGLSLTLTEDNLLICVCRDVSARKEAERKLQQTAAQLEASNQELEAFAYSVSHDLRSPLRAIDGFSNALIEDYGDRFDDDARDYFDRIRRNIQRMGMLIDDLLRLSRVSRSEMQYVDVNLSALVQEQIDELQAINPERQVKLAIAPNIIVSADRALMQVVISNLVQNAWKFTSHHDSAMIEFGVLQQEERLTYFMRDDGAGFNMTFANMLFRVFQRLHNTNEFPGTGIGLATVQRAIHRHGGRVWAEGAVEQGATMYFTVPNISIKQGG